MGRLINAREARVSATPSARPGGARNNLVVSGRQCCPEAAHGQFLMLTDAALAVNKKKPQVTG